jgi:hypothetical protein
VADLGANPDFELATKVMGERLFSSAHSAMLRLNPTFYNLIVTPP